MYSRFPSLALFRDRLKLQLLRLGRRAVTHRLERLREDAQGNERQRRPGSAHGTACSALGRARDTGGEPSAYPSSRPLFPLGRTNHRGGSCVLITAPPAPVPTAGEAASSTQHLLPRCLTFQRFQWEFRKRWRFKLRVEKPGIGINSLNRRFRGLLS